MNQYFPFIHKKKEKTNEPLPLYKELEEYHPIKIEEENKEEEKVVIIEL
ncbi:MAG TPA: hypothetical protein VNW06_02020 [Cytophagaceae bacterium]|jgi:hypothetical protein|nr:hypothetical protein [Cytophagaceae bacterium]